MKASDLDDMSVNLSISSGVATITMQRAEVHNAFDETLIASLTQTLKVVDQDSAVRVVVLAAAGKSFSAGADLNWMKKMATYTQQQNLADANKLSDLMHTLNSLSKPSIAKVQGSAFGGGVGLIACCDIAVASDVAQFCLSEVRLGLIPAVISPYVIAAIGERASRRYFLTAERFDSNEALRLGLLHQVVTDDELDQVADDLCTKLKQAGPRAIAAAKKLILDLQHKPLDGALQHDLATRIADLRASDEGQEGLDAFLNKTKPNWIKN